jgi:nucleoside-diphosphate-sugar epimerase
VSEKRDTRSVVVLGGCGFVGSHIVRHLLVKGVAVTLIDRCEAAALPLFVRTAASNGSFRFVQSELESIDVIREALERSGGADLVNCAAVLPGPRTPMEFIETNGLAVWRICELARTCELIGRLVHVSTRSVYGRYNPDEGPLGEDMLPRPVDYYGASKAAGDLAIAIFRERAGIDAAAIRITGIYGILPDYSLDRDHSGNPVMAMIAAGRKGEPFVANAAAHYRYEVTYVKDVVRAVITLLHAEKPRDAVYNLSGADGQPTLREIAMAVRSIFPNLQCEYPDAHQGPPPRAAMLGARFQSEFGYRPAWPLDRAFPDYVHSIELAEYGASAE